MRGLSARVTAGEKRGSGDRQSLRTTMVRFSDAGGRKQGEGAKDTEIFAGGRGSWERQR